SLPGSAFVREIGPFNDRWQRDVKLVNPQGVTTFQQRLTALSPYAARVDSINYPWRVCYFTQELGLEAVKKLLDTYPDPNDANGSMDIEKRMKRFRFLLQAGWLLAAQEELDLAQKEFPAEKERVDRAASALGQAKVNAFWEE